MGRLDWNTKRRRGRHMLNLAPHPPAVKASLLTPDATDAQDRLMSARRQWTLRTCWSKSATSRALAEPRSRKAPFRNSSTVISPEPSRSRRQKRPLASEGSTSMALKKATICGASNLLSNTGQDMASVTPPSKLAKSSLALLTMKRSRSVACDFKTDCTKTPVTTLSIANTVKATYIEKRMPMSGDIDSMRGSERTAQSTPPVIAMNKLSIVVPREP
mmetsp:Transcript_2825/g.11138  ORF Transcript_2825/g.11138 Transcript_2825/m.11138 type:complete len:217 (-) Transcript_2825:906-1556(-)